MRRVIGATISTVGKAMAQDTAQLADAHTKSIGSRARGGKVPGTGYQRHVSEIQDGLFHAGCSLVVRAISSPKWLH